MRLLKREPLSQKFDNWDITTKKNHNFLANGLVVHNSNARYCVAKNKEGETVQFCGSRTNWMKEDDKNIWWMCFRQNPSIGEWCRANPEKLLFGEVFGQVQSLKYGATRNQLFFAGFALLQGNVWQDYDTLVELTKPFNVPLAPLLYRGPFDPEQALALAEGDSSWPGANHMREGVVILPKQERTCEEIGRVCLKMVSNRYLESGK